MVILATASKDSGAVATPYDINGGLIGPVADSEWLYVVPWGFGKVLKWVADRYDNPPIYVTENGCSVPRTC